MPLGVIVVPVVCAVSITYLGLRATGHLAEWEQRHRRLAVVVLIAAFWGAIAAFGGLVFAAIIGVALLAQWLSGVAASVVWLSLLFVVVYVLQRLAARAGHAQPWNRPVRRFALIGVAWVLVSLFAPIPVARELLMLGTASAAVLLGRSEGPSAAPPAAS
jgi:hypothetical protein